MRDEDRMPISQLYNYLAQTVAQKLIKIFERYKYTGYNSAVHTNMHHLYLKYDHGFDKTV